MIQYSTAIIRKKIKTLERRKAHLEASKRGSYDVSEADALKFAIEAMHYAYPERPVPFAQCGKHHTHDEHEWKLDKESFKCRGHLHFEGGPSVCE